MTEDNPSPSQPLPSSIAASGTFSNWPLATSSSLDGSADGTAIVKNNLQWFALLVLVAATGSIYLCLRVRNLRWRPGRTATGTTAVSSFSLGTDDPWFIPPPVTQRSTTTYPSSHLPLVRYSEPVVIEEPMPVHPRERRRQQQLEQHYLQQQAVTAIGRRHHRRRRRRGRPRAPPPAYPDASSHPPPPYNAIDHPQQSLDTNGPYRPTTPS